MSGYWAAATGTARLDDPIFRFNPLVWSGTTCRLIGAMNVRSDTADTGATQPTIQITAGGTDLLGSALSVTASASTTGVIASGQAVSNAEAIDVDVESTGTNADSYCMSITFLIARHV